MTVTTIATLGTSPAVTVDLSKCNINVERRLMNAISHITVPSNDGKTKSIPINLSMIVEKYDVTFDLKDGVNTGSTYEKLETMFGLKSTEINNRISFIWNGRAAVNVVIETLSSGTKAGHKDLLMGCSITLTVTTMFAVT